MSKPNGFNIKQKNIAMLFIKEFLLSLERYQLEIDTISLESFTFHQGGHGQ